MNVKYLYILTDGAEIYQTAVFTHDEWVDARRSAANASDGNVNWDKVSTIPVSDHFVKK